MDRKGPHSQGPLSACRRSRPYQGPSKPGPSGPGPKPEPAGPPESSRADMPPAGSARIRHDHPRRRTPWDTMAPRLGAAPAPPSNDMSHNMFHKMFHVTSAAYPAHAAPLLVARRADRPPSVIPLHLTEDATHIVSTAIEHLAIRQLGQIIKLLRICVAEHDGEDRNALAHSLILAFERIAIRGLRPAVGQQDDRHRVIIAIAGQVAQCDVQRIVDIGATCGDPPFAGGKQWRGLLAPHGLLHLGPLIEWNEHVDIVITWLDT